MSREIHFYGNKGTPANGGEMAWWSGLKMVKHTHWSALFVYCDIFKSYLHMFSGYKKNKKKKLPACLMLLKKNVHDLIGGIQQSVRS